MAINKLIIENSNGNVGIGTTNPDIYSLSFGKQVTIASPTLSYACLTITGNTTSGGEIDFGNQTIRHAAIASLNGSNLTFWTNSTNSGAGVSERLRITADGNVSIGTTTPLSILTAQRPNTASTSNFANKTVSAVAPLVGGYTYNAIVSLFAGYDGSIHAVDYGYSYDSSGYNLHLSTNSTTSGNPSIALTIDRLQNVGIGTTNPNSRLEISGSTFNRLSVTATANVQSGIQIRRTGATAATDWEIYTPAGNTDLRFYNSSDRVTFASGGNVGIGITNPSYRLTVKHTGGAALSLQSTGSTTGTPTQDWYDLTNQTEAILSCSNGQIDFGSYTNHPLVFRTNNGDRMRITADGNVGIGITDPAYKLHVQDVTNTGNIAIGSALYPGVIYSNAGSGEFRIDNRASSAAGYITFFPNGQQNSIGDEAMRIDVNRNVGIGTTNPGRRLDILNSGSDSRVVLIRRGAQGNDPSLSTSFGRPYLQIGGIEYRTNSIQSIGFGWQETAGGTNPPGEIGFVTTSTASYTLGDLVFGTRNVVTNTAVTERMRITSQGYITTPYQPSFSAYLSDTWSHPSGVALVTGAFLTQHNTGGHYSTSTRRFTAPISGVYKFDCIIATVGGSGSFSYLSAELWVNGVRTRTGGWGCGGAGGSYGETASSYVIQLNAGDYAELACESDKVFTLQHGSSGHTMFSGYLIG